MDNTHLKKMIKDLITGQPVRLKFYHIDTEMHLFINALLLKILAHYDLLFIIHSLETMIHELLSNAYKANLKRIYFSEQKLDISNPAHFKKGIKKFRTIVYDDLDQYHEQLKVKNLYMELSVNKTDTGLCFTVINNARLSPIEIKRINERFNRIGEYDNFMTAYDDFFDESEGAGIGIIMTYFLLKESGIDPSVFKINSHDGLTESSIHIPFRLKPIGVVSDIKKQIIEEIDLLPSIPPNVTDLIALCDDPESSVTRISLKIISNPALSADVLKLANATSVAAGHHIDRIEEAVITIGISELKMLLLAAGTKKILQKRFKAFEKIWSDCQKTACFGVLLAREFGKAKIADRVYLGGLLHDLGKIILLSISEDITNKIADIASNRHIRETTMIEEIAIGISHTDIGEMIAGKWGFPENLKMMISHHHTPMEVDDQYKDQVLLTYLADIFHGIEDGRYEYSHIEEEVLDWFGIKNEKTVSGLIAKCSRRFNECPRIL